MRYSVGNRFEEDDDDENVVRFKKPKRINITLVLFCAVLIYVLVVLFIYLRTTHIVRYQVVEGSLATNTIYRGIAVRNEKLVSNDNAGYVNYIAREGQRVSVGDLVYLVDESGTLNDYIEAQSLGENTLTDRELNDFRTDIINFAHGYDNTDFDSVYDFKYSLKNTVSKLANTKLLNNMGDTASGLGSVSFKYCYSGNTGIVSYWYDGYEQLKPNEINASCFNEKEYVKNLLLSNELRAVNEQVYKLSVSDEWSVVFPVTEEVGNQLLEEDYILVKFLKNQDTAWGKVTILHNLDGVYAQLSFTNSMISYVDDRYLDIELQLGDEKGLKIPVSSIAKKEFFVIDENYVTEDENDNYTVLMQVYGADGTRTASAVRLEVYYYDEEMKAYYVDDTILSNGDILFGSDQTTYTVGLRGTLIGVYNINRGYADFKQISILYQNDEYAIVKSNTAYGLRVYDYIALDADSASDDQFISQSK